MKKRVASRIWEDHTAQWRYASMPRLATFGALALAACAGPPAVAPFAPPVSSNQQSMAPRGTNWSAGTIAPPHPAESVAPTVGLSLPPTPHPPDPASRITSDAGEVLLYDPEASDDRGWATTPTLSSADAIAQAAKKRILDSVFRNKYLTDWHGCIDEAARMSQAEQRTIGDFVPIVQQIAIGSFTESRVAERLYLISVCECSYASRAALFGSAVLAVFRGEALISRIALDGNMYHIRLVSDVHGDGRSEFLISSDYGGGGNHDETAKLVRIEGSQLVVIKDFGEVEDTRCGGGRPDPGFRSSRLYMTPGSPPSFRIQERVGSCP
jgi:hypothetical protein